jgi:hypothetical protein
MKRGMQSCVFLEPDPRTKLFFLFFRAFPVRTSAKIYRDNTSPWRSPSCIRQQIKRDTLAPRSLMIGLSLKFSSLGDGAPASSPKIAVVFNQLGEHDAATGAPSRA